MLNASLFSWDDQDISSMIGPDFCFSTSKKHPTRTFRTREGYREELIAHLLNHGASPDKGGSCWSPAVYRKGQFGTQHAYRVDVVAFDLDKGQPLAEIKNAVAGREAVIVSTHSHQATQSCFPRTDLEKAGWDAEAFMRSKGYHESVYTGAQVKRDEKEKPITKTVDGKPIITIEHEPCAKFRVILFPVRSWVRSEEADMIRYRLGLQKLADNLGLMIDRACTGVARLYFDSRHRPGSAPIAEYIEGAPVDPWSNVEIPAEMMRASGKSDPREKGGIIGEFNRAFPILEAITEFDLPYEESGNRPGRLTYLGSTNGNGAEILHNGYTMRVYSESDPVHTHCESPNSGFGFANSFDLVRVHRFREMDTAADMAFRVQERPSFKATMDFARRALAADIGDEFTSDDVDGMPNEDAAGGSARRVTAKPFTWVDPKMLPPREWLYGHHYIRKYLSATVAPGGLGKSSLSIVEALSMATGHDLLNDGAPCMRSHVWMHNGEDPLEETRKRITAAMMFYKIAPEDVEGWLFITSGRDEDLVIAEATRDGTKLHRPVVDALVDEINDKGVSAFILDPFVSCHAVSENDNPAVNAVAKAWKEVAERANCGVEVIHHMRKRNLNDKGEPDANDARGASALVDAARSIRVLARVSGAEAEKLGLVEERRRYFYTASGKANLVPPIDKRVWRKLESISLGNANDIYPADSIQVVAAWAIPAASAGLFNSDIIAAQKAIAEGEWRESVQANQWAGRAIAEALEWDIDEPGVRQKLKSLLKEWISAGWLKVEKRKDNNRKERGFIVIRKIPAGNFDNEEGE